MNHTEIVWALASVMAIDRHGDGHGIGVGRGHRNPTYIHGYGHGLGLGHCHRRAFYMVLMVMVLARVTERRWPWSFAQ